MMIEQLRWTAPHVYDRIKALLIGEKGMKANGAASGGIVRYVEDLYNATPGSFWYREMRPDDTFVGGTAKQYYATFTTATEEHLLALGSENTVPTREAIACFGWYCTIDLHYKGYLRITKFGVEKQVIPARLVWRQTEPDNYIFNLDRVMIGVQNEKFGFITYNGYGSDRSGTVVPLLYRIASRSALNLELPQT